MSKIKRIQTKLNIHSNRRSLLLLEGEYLSALKGKSLDFDDLREYAYGDDVRDIDWKASARQTTPLVKRYVANRRHNVLFVVDTSLTMLAASPEYTPKHELATDVMGVLGYIAVKHNDNVALATMNGKYERSPFMGGETHLNRLLDTVEAKTAASAGVVDLTTLLTKANSASNSRSIMVIITSEATPSDELKTILRKLHHRNELLWVSIADINPASIPQKYSVMDVADRLDIPEGLRGDAQLIREMEEEDRKRKEELHDFLTGLRVTNGTVSSAAEVIPTLLTMLKRREHAN